MRRAIFFLVAVFAFDAFAFIPPVPAMCSELTRGRRNHFGLEITLRHRVAIRGNQIVDIEERVMNRGGLYYFTFNVRSPGPMTIKAELKNGKYVFSGGQTMGQRSQVLLEALFALKGDRLERQLVREQFVRRDQLIQFKPGFKLEGDPRSWNPKGNYLRHPDIFLTRIPIGPAITVQGTNESEKKRIVYFRRDFKSLARLEWTDGSRNVLWDFQGIRKEKVGGYYPKRLSFNLSGNSVVTSDLISVKSYNGRGWPKATTAWRSASASTAFTPAVETALKLLLSYR